MNIVRDCTPQRIVIHDLCGLPLDLCTCEFIASVTVKTITPPPENRKGP